MTATRAAIPGASSNAAGGVSKGRRLYALGLMTMVYFFYLMDRNAVVITQELFKAEFQLSDTQVGLVTGILYGGAYAIVGLPIGWLIQRTHRVRLLSLLVGVWSGVTLLCGLANQFWHLAVARILVGGAESGGAPVSLSILYPMFSQNRRATVSSIFFAGAGLGVVVSFMAGGFLAGAYGWRSVFLFYGAPGLLLALLILLTIPEPLRSEAEIAMPRTSLWRDLKTLLSDRDLLPVYLGAMLFSCSNAGIGVWMVSFMIRVHDFTLPQAGATVSITLGVCGTIGSLAIGILADRFERARSGGLLLLMAMAALFNGLTGIAAALAGSPTLAIFFFALWGATSIAYSGPSNAAIAELAPPRLIGLAFGLFAILCNLVGSGLGPLFVGAVSDVFHARLGDNSVRPSLIAIASTQVLTLAAFLVAAQRWRARARIRAAGLTPPVTTHNGTHHG